MFANGRYAGEGNGETKSKDKTGSGGKMTTTKKKPLSPEEKEDADEKGIEV